MNVHAKMQPYDVEAIRKAGGFVHYDYEMVNGEPTIGREPRAPSPTSGAPGASPSPDYVTMMASCGRA